MNKSKLSVVLATRNEETNLDKCLASVATLADEIVIADERSEDKTVEIAKKYKARIIKVDHQNNFHINKNVAIEAAKGDWVLQLDADEAVSPELAQEIENILKNGSEYDGMWVNRRNWFLNRFLTKGGQYPDPTLRFYRRGKGKLPARDVHEQAVVGGSVGHFKHDLLHYRDTSFEKYLQGFNRYSSFIATQMVERHESLNIFNTFNYLVIKPIITFLKLYFRHRGYIDGTAGFIFAAYSGLIHPVSYIKYWQMVDFPA